MESPRATEALHKENPPNENIRRRHHQALAGGTLISQLPNAANPPRTPPGFSRWYFNFTATKCTPELESSWLFRRVFCSDEVEGPPAKAWWCLMCRGPMCSDER